MTSERGSDDLLIDKFDGTGMSVPGRQVAEEDERLDKEAARMEAEKPADNEEGPEYPERPPAEEAVDPADTVEGDDRLAKQIPDED